jgi:Ca2+-binding RTX toxin-like protein
VADHSGDNVSFTLTFASGALNSVPAGTDRVTISVDGAADTRIYRLTPEPGSSTDPLTVSFVAVAGNHTYTAKAWSGNTLLGTIGPIDFTTVAGFPLTIPLAFSFAAFDSYHTDVGTPGPNSQIFFGTAGRDRVVQYGGATNDLQSVDAGAGNDWSEQYGGGGVDTLIADSGTGHDYVLQKAGSGSTDFTASTGDGDDWVIQAGGDGSDKLNCQGGAGNDNIRQEGGAGNDSIFCNGGTGNDTALIVGGSGDDTITYDVSPGMDTADIDGGTGTDTLTVNRNGQSFLLKDSTGSTLYQYGSGGTVITVANLEQITVLDSGGTTLFTWSAP